ncbi:MAG: ribosomal protein S18-alanine N-acetyltransferase [Pseudomonadota bacterium]
MGDVRIRAATLQDAAQLIALERDAFGERSWGADAVAGAFKAPGAHILLSLGDGPSLTGFAIWRAAADEAEILTIGVAHAALRKGIAKALLKRVLSDAQRGGATAVFLEVDTSNKAAIALYEGCDFVSAGRRKGYYRNGADALLMRKIL